MPNLASSTPVVSVIVPTRNRAGILMKALTTIMEQSFADFEVLIIDDCSDEKAQSSYDASKKTLDDRFKFFLTGLNSERENAP